MSGLLRSKRFHAILAWLITGIFFVSVILPIVVERISVTDQSKVFFFEFELKDETGKRHIGWFCPGFMYFMDVDFLEYGYEAPDGTDVSSRRQKFVDNRDRVKTEDGFVWGKDGFLWASFYRFEKRGWMKEGGRLGLNRPVAIGEQTELTLPGAPWDMQSATTSLFGHWPNYETKFNNEFFDFDLKMTPRQSEWILYNKGKPFSAGDFGRGSMNEVGVDVVGTIQHKVTGKTFTVTGTGLMQDSAGVPWGYASWGAHAWTAIHFDGGWDGSIWKAEDNWQWGYNHGPHTGWMHDPERKTSYTFERVDVSDIDYEVDETTGAKWMKGATWTAIGADATLVMQTKGVSWIPGELKIPPSPISMKMAHGLQLANAQLVRRDGTSVELKNGQAIGEHYNALFPDYVFFGPLMLVLLVLSWSAYAGAIRREEGKSLMPPVVWCLVGLFATWFLYYQWAHAPMVT